MTQLEQQINLFLEDQL